MLLYLIYIGVNNGLVGVLGDIYVHVWVLMENTRQSHADGSCWRFVVLGV